MPRSSCTHANFPPLGAAVRSEGKGADMTCSRVKDCARAGTAAQVTKSETRPSNRVLRDMTVTSRGSDKVHIYRLQCHFVQEAVAASRQAAPLARARQHQPIPGPGHAHVQQSARFLDLATHHLVPRTPARQLAVLRAHDVHAVELEALGGMQR